MRRTSFLLYGTIIYAIFLGVFLYALGFMANVMVPKSVDAGAGLLGGPPLLVNLGLLALFAVQHSVMARPAFKQWWTKFVPQTIERSTYVMATNLCLIALFVLWQPMPAIVWNVESTLGRIACWTLFAGGWGLVLISTFLINHFDLFGLRQVWLRWRGKAYTEVGFVQPAVYRLVRHPLYVGWMTAFWATPTMTLGHILFAAVMTAYMLIAIQLEERNLVQAHGEKYREYRRRTPMLLPIPRRAAAPQPVSAGSPATTSA
jgi:protein-S-isoprenylcysteine O-methyltransferase Ste14